MKRFSENGLNLDCLDPRFVWMPEMYVFVRPGESESGRWEVWKCDAELEIETASPSDIELLPESKVLEFDLPEDVSFAVAHALLGALSIGFEMGREEGSREVKAGFKYALDALTGAADETPLLDAASGLGYD